MVATPTSSNFGFLTAHDPALAALGALAERNFAADPNTTLLKLRQLAEQLAQRAAAAAGLYVGVEEAQSDLLRRLQQRGILPRNVADLFHAIRKAGNRAMHELKDDRMETLHQLRLGREVAIWFHRTFGASKGFAPGPFVPPSDPDEANKSVVKELERLRDELSKTKLAEGQARAIAEEAARGKLSADERAKKESDERAVWEALATEAEKKLASELEKIQKRTDALPEKAIDAVASRAAEAAGKVELDEVATRRLIDAQLRDAGWDADTEALSFAQGVQPTKGRNLAIAEWPANDARDADKAGRADYVLFHGLEAVAVIEAKRESKNVASVIESDAKAYARSLTLTPDQMNPAAPWGKYKVPFLFATNGRPYLRQIQEQSGVWFLDGRRKTNHPRPLEGWFRPEDLQALLKADLDQAVEALRAEPMNILGLHDFQREGIRKVEEGIGAGQRSLLLAMATGTGKTRTAIALAYRLLKTKAVRRILFVVDRESLGDQAQDAFKDARIETTRTFADIYELKELRDIRPESDTKVHFATIQGLVHRVLYPTDERPAPSVGQYDCVIVDECHRGYTLDQEMTESELGFRDYEDYVSIYRRALEHFDAIKIGLTATPAVHTEEIFGKAVFTYSYRSAVIDGVLIDHEPPTRIVTTLAKDGMKWKAGEEMEILVDRKGSKVDKVTLPDEVAIEIDGFNKKVITEAFNQVVCERLVTHLDPNLDEKTLIFAADDDHADMVVRLLKAAFEAQGTEVDDDAIVKITGSAVQKRPKLIKLFKNERFPNIAVTVDLLTTGIDVPKICNLVFLRRVKSRILYEQMLGRATRRCEAIGKQVFHIYDAVDLYRDMQKYSSMKPVVTKPSITFEQLIREVVTATAKEHKQTALDQLIAKLRRKAARLSGEALEVFETIAGMSPNELADKLRRESPTAAAQWLAVRPKLVGVLDRKVAGDYPRIVSHHTDSLHEVTRGYGEGLQRPGDYLESFKKFLADNLNKIPALVVVTQRPRDLTRTQLKELKAALDEKGYSETALRTAWRDTTNADIAASIIGYIRQAALGDPLQPYDQRVERALQRLLASRAWTDKQRTWLQRIGKQLKTETVLDRQAFDQGQFKTDGGFRHVDKVFDGALEDVLGEMRASIWQSAG